MELELRRPEREEVARATAENPDAALDAAITYCRYTGGAPLRVYADGEPFAVVSIAVVETEEDMEALGA